MIGQTLGPYRVLKKLGQGGMGEVYRAHDPRLERDVALKVLPAAFARDADQLARFEREVRTVAALSDPHIVPVYDVGQDAGVPYFAAELVEGADLEVVLSGGPLPLKEALDVAAQIAAGLAAAHAKGIVHRDLKPANVLVSAAGHAKIADFGLAKAAEPNPADPTLTEAGTIMGTVAYMSPEQAAGRSVDFRSDQFSFGAMLYEMLTGRPAFRRASAAETLAAILNDEPEPVLHANPSVPAPLAWVLDRCLDKNPTERYGSTEDLAKDLDGVRDRLSTLSSTTVTPPPPSRMWAMALLAAAVAGVALLAYAVAPRHAPPAPARVLRTNIDLPPGVDLAPFEENGGPTLALSPDGSHLVMVGERNGRTQLYLRPLHRAETRPVAGTDGARGPFFSPDGQSVGFWADGRLKRIRLAGGGPSVICDATTESGAVWMPDDTILFSTGLGLLRVSAQGGQPQVVTTPDASKNEYSHVWPTALPATKAVVFSIKYTGGGPQASRIGLLDLDSRRWTTLATDASEPRFVAPGFLFINRGGTLEAAPFDLASLAIRGSFTSIEDNGSPAPGDLNIAYDVSASGGGLVYATARSGTQQERTIYSVDLRGKAEPLTTDRKAYWAPAVSPDGSRLAVNVLIDVRTSEIWVLDLVRRTWLRLTAGSNDWQPRWRDRQTLIYTRGKGGSATWDEYSLSSAGSGTPTLLASFPQQVGSHAVSPDRRQVVFSTRGESSYDLWLQPLDLHAPARPLLASPANEQTLSQGFSPDGRWLAYMSDATGRPEVYVTDFPAATARYPVSTGGGRFPCWSHDGRQIFYWQDNTVMAVEVQAGAAFAAGAPRALFDSPVAAFEEFDLAPDGRHFYMIGAERRSETSQIVFVSDVGAALQSRTGSR